MIGLFSQFILSRILSKYSFALSKTLKNFGALIFILIGFVIAHPYLDIDERTKLITEKVLEFFLVFLVFVSISYLVNQAIDNYFRKFEFIPSISLFKNFITILIIITGLLFSLHNVNVKVTALITGLGIASLPIALALQTTLANIFAGLQIILSKQLKIGDYIKLSSGEEGYVIDINWRNTIIRKLDNNVVIIPNSKLADSIITNYNLFSSYFYISVPISVNYNGDLDRLENIILKVAKESLNLYPKIILESFSSSTVNLNVFLEVKEFSEHQQIKNKFLREIYKEFKENGII